MKQRSAVERRGAVLMHRLGVPGGSRGDACPGPTNSCAEQLRAALRRLSSGDGPGAGMRAGRAPVVGPTGVAPSEALPDPPRRSPLHLIALDKLSSLLMSEIQSLALQSGLCKDFHGFSMHCV